MKQRRGPYLARMVDVPGETATHRSVHHVLFVEPKHVDASILLLVQFLSFVCDLIPYQFADVLDNHGVLFKITSREQAKTLEDRQPHDEMRNASA